MDHVPCADMKNMLLYGAAYVLEKALALIYSVSKYPCNCKFKNY